MQVVFAIIKRQATSSSLLEAGDEYYQGKYEQAEPLYQRALAISEQALPPDHTDIATTLENYASLLSAGSRDQLCKAYPFASKSDLKSRIGIIGKPSPAGD